jgi:hypothetical protein
MRILIIALARSGGYQLNEWLALELGYKPIHEPIRTNESIEGDNIVVKYITTDIKDKIKFDFNNWDKIIGLIRNDTMECAKSFVYAEQTSKWHIGYEITNEWIESNKENIIEVESLIKNEINFIKELNGIQLQITYERIYNTKEDLQRIKDYIGITNTKYEHLLDNTNRLRNRSKTKRKLL